MSVEREVLDVDVLFVGGGPGSLAGAYHLARLLAQHNEKVTTEGSGTPLEPMIVLIDKANEIGSHGFSGRCGSKLGYGTTFAVQCPV